MSYDLRNKRVWVAGHNGMIGSAICRRLERENCELLTVDRSKLDLKDQAAVRQWIDRNKPDTIFIAAAKVGGILANSLKPVDFLYDNLVIETNIIEAAHRSDVDRLLFLGSSCIYPKFAEQPIQEESLLTGPLEPTNEWYAIAKIAGIKLCQAYRKQFGRDYISAMPTNLYGPGDNFDLETSHVLPALIRKTHSAKLAGDNAILIWGTGTPKREFLYSDDCADALVFLMKNYSDYTHVNVGSGIDISIYDLAQMVCQTVGFTGTIKCDASKPDGTPRKLMSAEKLIGMGWQPSLNLPEGLHKTYQWYLQNIETAKGRCV